MWTRGDRLDALAWQSEQDLRCPGCGQPKEEAYAEDAGGAVGRLPAYEPVDIRCHACQQIERAQKQFAEDKNPMMGSLYFGVRRIPDEKRVKGQVNGRG